MNLAKDLDESREPPGSDTFLELLLGRGGMFQDGGFQAPSAGGEADEASALVGGIGLARGITAVFEMPDQIIDGLFRDLHAFGELGGALAVEPLIAEEGDMRRVEVVEAVAVNALVDPLANAFPGETEEGADVAGVFRLNILA